MLRVQQDLDETKIVLVRKKALCPPHPPPPCMAHCVHGSSSSYLYQQQQHVWTIVPKQHFPPWGHFLNVGHGGLFTVCICSTRPSKQYWKEERNQMTWQKRPTNSAQLLRPFTKRLVNCCPKQTDPVIQCTCNLLLGLFSSAGQRRQLLRVTMTTNYTSLTMTTISN